MREVTAVRFVLPLREGGSLPALVEGDDGALWVAKLRGAGQGAGALLSELVAGVLAAAVGLPMPELVYLTLPPRFGVTEGDPEIHALLSASLGDNVGMAFLPAAIGYDPAARGPVSAELAARVLAFDVLLGNVDRTFRNPNLVWSGGELWLIDHGAALYWQHAWDGGLTGAAAPLPRLREHVLSPLVSADELASAARWLVERADDAALAAALAVVPAAWLGGEDAAGARRAAFVARLAHRREQLAQLVEAGRGG
ncbi:MAG: aminotransferase class I and II [Myxococcales bacterium]|nr:aminotransferase class I and II [Myxococcales bacterium]